MAIQTLLYDFQPHPLLISDLKGLNTVPEKTKFNFDESSTDHTAFEVQVAILHLRPYL